jgi:hypothetical protein
MNSSRARDDATLIPNLGDDCPAARLGLPFSVLPRFLQRAFVGVESELKGISAKQLLTKLEISFGFRHELRSDQFRRIPYELSALIFGSSG